MAIEIIPKKETAKLPALHDILFYLSFVFLIATALAYFTLVYQEEKSVKEMTRLEGELALRETPELRALEQQVLTNRRKINDFAAVAKAHVWSSNLFDLLEDLAHPEVSFSELDLDANKSVATVSGKTKRFASLGQQLEIFKKGKFVKNVNLSKVAIEREGGIGFTIDISFDRQMFLESYKGETK